MTQSHSALFLDRDGVINVDHGYVHDWSEFDLVPGIGRVIAAANEAGRVVVVVTNQSGIARGYFTEAQMQALHDRLCIELAVKGALIDRIYFCPYLPNAPVATYARESDERKPAPGMILRAAREMNLDLSRSALVGDKPTDMAAARAAGIDGHLFVGGNLWEFVSARLPDLVKSDQKSGFACNQST